MRFEVQTRLHTNWLDVRATRNFAEANLTAYTNRFPDAYGGFPWGIYNSHTTDMLKVLNDEGTLIGFALFDNTARHWGPRDPMLVLDVYADSDETLAAMMKHLVELARTPGRTKADMVDVGKLNERGQTALRRLGFNRVAFAYMSGAGERTDTLRKMSSLEFETAKGNVPGLVAMTSLSREGLTPGGAPLPEVLENKITGFLAPGGREERPEIALSKTARILRNTGVSTRPPGPPPPPPPPPGGYGPAAAGGPGGPPAGGRRKRTVRRRKTRKSRRQVKSRH